MDTRIHLEPSMDPPRIPEDTRRHRETYPPYHALMHKPRHNTCTHTPPHIRTSVLRTLQY
eukprot:8921688-Pyramimonas_sp.AAC.1